MKEFARIARYLAPLASPEGLALQDDAALIPGPGNTHWAITKDAIVEGVHFLPLTAPALIAQKLLRTNLSDMAAMGAQPKFYLIAAALPSGISDTWYRDFTKALKQEQKAWGISLIGGDTVSTSGALTLSCTMIGDVPRGKALLRSGAKAGNAVYVSGTLGDAALGLQQLHAGKKNSPFIGRHHTPEPRVQLGIALRGIATACMDISDGLLQDMGHICGASGVAATLYAEKLPHAKAVTLEQAATGGDDYELLFTVPVKKENAVQALAKKLSLPLTRIGNVTAGKGGILVDNHGKSIKFNCTGYRHG